MLSRLIVTFLCAATIESVSGAFLTFDPDPVVFKDTSVSAIFSVKLNSKPIEAVTVYLEHRSMSMSVCVMIFNPDTWDVPQYITGVSAPLFVGSSPPTPLEAESKLLAKAVAVGPLPPELSTIDTLEVKQTLIPFYRCSTTDNGIKPFDSLVFTLNKLGWYRIVSTRDLEVQVKVVKCTEKQICITTILVRYGSTAMSMNVSGSAKGIGEYSMTYVTSSTNGIQYHSNPKNGEHMIDFPYGSSLHVKVVNNNGIMSLNLIILLSNGYPSPGGLCNKLRFYSRKNRLVGPDGKLYSHKKKEEVDAFVDSWSVKDEDVLTNPGAKTLIPSIQPGAVCRIPVDPRPNPVVPAPITTITTTTTTTTAATTTTTTAAATTTSAAATTTTGTTATAPYYASTSPSTTSSTSIVSPAPPAPDGYIPPPPPPPPPDVVVEIKKCCQSIFNIPSCNAIVPTEPYIQSCISDAQTFGSYVLSDKVKQTYLDKCRALTDDMISRTTKDVVDHGTQIRKECGFGNATCINSCSGQGTCTDFGCACSPGFSGMDCSMDLTKANQYDPSVDQYRINVNITIVQEQMEQHSELPISVPYATPAPSVPSVPYATPAPSVPSVPYATPAPSVHSTPSVDQSLVSYVGSLPKPSAVSPQIAEKSQPPYPELI
ncbi:hypothetical protein BASA50_006264 [Batrachochytrium salamandrivorans]|uniref:VWFD domain-containing protein n=1 Tax=Batrachochytrium salamandrivorans TaxID=1357716 RepID=A0ABQ8FAA1_9FUNG|nr:hypothetical protein BASA50_006264 [Batrachochytrium salamandrivorans]